MTRFTIKVRNPVVRDLIAGIFQKPQSLTNTDFVDEVQSLLVEEGDFENATDLAGKMKLEIPNIWYEGCLKKAISVGDYFNASAALEVLDRQLEQPEIIQLIEQIILAGDMQALMDIEENSNETFSLAVWQNIMLIRTVRLMWEKRYDEKSPLSSLFFFASDYEKILDHFEIVIIGEYTFFMGKKTFKCYDQYTMSQFMHCLSNLDGDALVKRIARGIMKNSAIS
jgi:hypothetical protein